ncbi:MAG: gamma-glutamyl-gamma-aminobutyrate hydrolase family protein [Pseudomonadota bacterium]
MGSLWTAEKSGRLSPKKDVMITQTSRLAWIAYLDEMLVNALHSQSVDMIGRDVQAVARDFAGMVQAVERVIEPFAIAVQWHKERLFYARRQRPLFNALVEAARAKKGDSVQSAAVGRLA